MENVLILGGVSYNLMIDVDDFPEPVPQTVFTKDFHETIGSTGAGKALALNRLGMKIKFHGVIGDDHYGKIIEDKFKQEGIPFYYDVDPAGTQRHVNLMNNKGERMSIFLHAPPPEIDLNKEQIEELIKESDLVIPNIAPHCKKFIPLIKKYQVETWYDLHDYDGKDNYYDEFIKEADVVFFSAETNENYKQVMKELIDFGKKLVVCTQGSKGAVALSWKGDWYKERALNYEVIDTNGAGDSFFAGFLYGYLNGYSIQESLRYGAITGGLAVTSLELTAEDLNKERLKQEYNKWFTD